MSSHICIMSYELVVFRLPQAALIAELNKAAKCRNWFYYKMPDN